MIGFLLAAMFLFTIAGGAVFGLVICLCEAFGVPLWLLILPLALAIFCTRESY